MKPISGKSEIKKLQDLVSEMTIDGCDFDAVWIRARGWKVVPVEDGNHFAPEDIAVLIPALNKAGYSECFAVATEPLGQLPACYHLSITKDDLCNFNSECGMFRYALMDEARSWAISCNEWYNLFAADPLLLESMIGKSIESARREYLNFAMQLSKNPDEPLMQIAKRYAEL